jgi:hypothetical protein
MIWWITASKGARRKGLGRKAVHGRFRQKLGGAELIITTGM